MTRSSVWIKMSVMTSSFEFGCCTLWVTDSFGWSRVFLIILPFYLKGEGDRATKQTDEGSRLRQSFDNSIIEHDGPEENCPQCKWICFAESHHRWVARCVCPKMASASRAAWTGLLIKKQTSFSTSLSCLWKASWFPPFNSVPVIAH